MKTLLMKDIKISLRTYGWMMIGFALVGCLPILMLSADSLNNLNDAEIIKIALQSMILFFPAVQIPMLGTVVIQTTLTEERKNRILHILIADGIKPEIILWSKVLASILLAYVLSLLQTATSLVYSRIFYGIWIGFNAQQCMILLVIVPIISSAFLCLIGILMWSSKQGQFIAGFFPMLSYMGSIYLSTKLSSNEIKANSLVILSTIALSLLLFGGCFLISKYISKEHIVNIE